MRRHIPGVPSLLKKLGIQKVGNFILPCLFQQYVRWLYEECDCSGKSLYTNEFDTIVTEPYGKIDMRIFSAVDPWDAYIFFRFLMQDLYPKPRKELTNLKLTNFLAYKCRIQDIPRIKEDLSRLLIKIKDGNYILKFSKSGRLKKVKKIVQNDLPKLGSGHLYPYYHGFTSVLLDKRSDINEEMLKRASTVIDHHTFHTYKDWQKYNPKGINEVLEAAKELGDTQLINLHHIGDKEDAERGIFPISELRKGIEEVGFDSIYHAQLKRRFSPTNAVLGRRLSVLYHLYHFDIRKLTDTSEIEDVETGNFRWLILKN